MQSLNAVASEIIHAIGAADSLDALEAIRIGALGKKGRISLMMRDLGGMDAEARKQAGQALNKVKDEIAAAIGAKQMMLASMALNARLSAERLDVSLPSRPEIDARLHPLSRTIEEVIAIFAEMGFQVAEGPDMTHFICQPMPMANARCFVRTHRRCRFGQWRLKSRQSASLFLGGPIGLTMTPHIHRCFINVKG